MPTVPSNDAEFEAWLDAHPHGYVVNCYRNPTQSYLRLHRANCHTTRSEQREHYAGGDSLKACGASKIELQEWAANEVGGTVKPCGICNP